jgi:hypothetical protein
MERQREKPKAEKELEKKTEKELDALRAELQRLKRLKKEKELKARQEVEEQKSEESTMADQGSATTGSLNIETRLEEIDEFLTKQLDALGKGEHVEESQVLETELQALEEEIVGEKGVIEEKVSPYEKLLENHSWISETRYEFMYSIPDEKKREKDFESWKTEWAKVMLDYCKYALLHVIYLSNLINEEPFTKFNKRKKAVKLIAEELVEQDLAEWFSRKKKKLRVYWKSLDAWASEIFKWAKSEYFTEPILIYEIREANREFSNLPREDLEEIFKILTKDDRGKLVKLDDGEVALKVNYY